MMTDMTVNRNISSIVPRSFFGGIKPLCVPMQPDSSFSDEVGSRFSTNVDSLWERLGLVFLIEEPQPEVPSRNEVVINNFSSKLIMQLFGNKNIRRLMEIHQPGNVYSDIVIKQAERRQQRTEQRISAEITERILQTERITAQLNAVSAMFSQKDDESCTVQMICSLLTNVMKRHIGAEELTFSETQVLDRLEQRLRSSENIHEKRLHTVIEELRTAEAAPNESRVRVLSAVAEHIGTVYPGSDAAIAAELAAQAVEEDGVTDIAERITQTVRGLDTLLTEKRYFGGVESPLRGEPEFRAVGKIKGIDEPRDISRSVTELLLQVTDGAEGRSVTRRIEDRFAGKGIEEIHRFIRSVNEQRRGINGSDSVVADIVGNVVCRIMERQTVMRSGGDNARMRAETVIPIGAGHSESTQSGRENQILSRGEGKVLLGEHNSYSLTHTGDVYLINSAENGDFAAESVEASGTTPAQGRVVTNEQNSYSINRSGDVYLTNIAENSSIFKSAHSAAGFTAKEYKPVSARNSGMSVVNSRILSLLSGAENLFAITEASDSPVYYRVIKSAVNRMMNIDRRLFRSGDEYVNSTILSGRENVYLPRENVGQVSSDIMRHLTDRTTLEARMPSMAEGLYSENQPVISQKNSYPLNRAGDVYISNTTENAASASESGNAPDTAAAAEGRILPTEQSSYTLNRAGDVYISNTTENAASAAKIGNAPDTAAAAEGRILPTEQNCYTLNRAGDVYISNTTENAASAAKIGNAPDTSTVAEGRILPTEQNSYTLNRAGDVYISNTTENAVSASESGNAPRTATTAEGRILPTEQNSYTLNRDGDVYISNTTENAVFAAKIGNAPDTAAAAEGRILPTEQNSYTLNRAGDVYISNTTENAVSAARIGNAPDTAAAAEGRILPTEQNSYTLNHAGDVYLGNTDMPPRSNETNLAGSYRSRLDSKTLAALDEMISIAGRRTSTGASEPSKESNASERVVENAEMVYAKQSEPQQDLQPMRTTAGSTMLDRAQLTQLRTAGIMRRGMGISPTNSSSHITAMIHRVNESSADIAQPKQVFSYRTFQSGEDMVMLVPPVEMDRYQAEHGYQRQMPSIELKQPQKPEQTEAASSVTKKVVNSKNNDISVKTIGSIEGLSREDINKLVDKVYDQLETRLLRERRRRGL